MRSESLAWTALLFVILTGGARAQDAPAPGSEPPGRAKGAFTALAVRDDVPATQTVAPGRAKGVDSDLGRIDDIDMLPTQVGGPKDKPKDKEKPPQPPVPEPPSDPFALAPPTGSEAPARLNPNMIGDLPGYFSLQNVLIGSVKNIVTVKHVQGAAGVVPVVTVYQVPTIVATVVRVPLAFSGPMKIGENQSPMPADRVYISYNYFNSIQAPGGSPGQVNSQAMLVGGVPTTINTPVPGGAPSIDLHSQTFGFEKTFLDGAASIGMRLPVAQVQGDGSIGQQDVGDISTLLNFAFFRDRATGSVLAGGLMVTAPTGPPVNTTVGNIHPWVLQPFFGYRWSMDRLYIQGFTSLAVPSDTREMLGMFNDVAVGYWVYRSGAEQLISAIIPTLEAHVTTPLDHRNPSDPINLPDFVALTAGVHIGLANRAMLTVGTTVPVTAPRLFPIEAVAQFNLRY
jgi:hypothetical protein